MSYIPAQNKALHKLCEVGMPCFAVWHKSIIYAYEAPKYLSCLTVYQAEASENK